MVLKVNEVSFGIEVRGEDLTVALQAEELALQQLGTVGLWQFLHGQCPGTDDDHSRRMVGFPEAGGAGWHPACYAGGIPEAGGAGWHPACCVMREVVLVLSSWLFCLAAEGFSSESCLTEEASWPLPSSHSLGSVRPHCRPHWD